MFPGLTTTVTFTPASSAALASARTQSVHFDMRERYPLFQWQLHSLGPARAMRTTKILMKGLLQTLSYCDMLYCGFLDVRGCPLPLRLIKSYNMGYKHIMCKYIYVHRPSLFENCLIIFTMHLSNHNRESAWINQDFRKWNEPELKRTSFPFVNLIDGNQFHLKYYATLFISVPCTLRGKINGKILGFWDIYKNKYKVSSNHLLLFFRKKNISMVKIHTIKSLKMLVQ